MECVLREGSLFFKFCFVLFLLGFVFSLLAVTGRAGFRVVSMTGEKASFLPK